MSTPRLLLSGHVVLSVWASAHHCMRWQHCRGCRYCIPVNGAAVAARGLVR